MFQASLIGFPESRNRSPNTRSPCRVSYNLNRVTGIGSREAGNTFRETRHGDRESPFRKPVSPPPLSIRLKPPLSLKLSKRPHRCPVYPGNHTQGAPPTTIEGPPPSPRAFAPIPPDPPQNTHTIFPKYILKNLKEDSADLLDEDSADLQKTRMKFYKMKFKGL